MARRSEPQRKMTTYERATAVRVRYWVYVDPQTEQRLLVPSADDLATEQQWIDGLKDNATTLLAEEDENLKDQGRQMLIATAIQGAQLKRRREAAEGLRQMATEHTVYLQRPDLRSFYAAKSLAMAEYPEGTGDGFDSVMALELLPIALGVDDASQIDADELTMFMWRKLTQNLHPSTDSLVFTWRAQSPT